MMRRFLLTVVTAAVAALGTAAVQRDWWLPRRPIVPGEAEVFFSPKGGCTDAVVHALRSARQSIRVQAYSFTNTAISKALVEAHRRNVSVEIVLDRSEEDDRYTTADRTAEAGIPTFTDAAHNIAHNKVIIIDDAVVITGSFNFTRAAEETNAENLLILHSPELAARYLANWQQHRSHSHAYHGGVPR